jgi:1-acyl-sn-glycerol-3-phosphate acyltransferase
MPEQAEPIYRVPLQNHIARRTLKPVFQGIFRLLANVKVTGMENVPFGKPYLAAINHISLFDPPFALTFWPEMIEAMGASTIWKKPGQAQLVSLYHVIPVHRGDFDKALFDTVLNVLRSGRPLLIAPEGTRSHREEMARARPGIAFIIEKSQVPVLPVGIVGTTDDFFKKAIRAERRTLELRIGKPMVLPTVEGKGDERRDARQRNADLVMAHIAGLLPEHYRGYYASMAIEPS